ncbi:uncharacterized protein A4U43_C04F1430 [Asparagus officinalis]|uniref:FAE domain-containing protein n=1 Tax=Asparagus officinalis TaxID=4686 RepID=A0A5P1F046_ASPOF|nr:uncharacterized protein A4U43_C04F1430 [Asparagus officinalis]
MEILVILTAVLLSFSLYPLYKLFDQWRNRGCYLIDYVNFRPTDDREIPTEFCESIVRRNKRLGLEEYRFLLRIIVSSGIGEHTYGPRNIVEGREDSPTHGDSLLEMDECFFGTLDALFARTGFAPADVDALVLNVSMFCPAPSLSARIVNRYRMREDVKVFNLSGMGCSASLISLDLVQNLMKCRRDCLAALVTSRSRSAPNCIQLVLDHLREEQRPHTPPSHYQRRARDADRHGSSARTSRKAAQPPVRKHPGFRPQGLPVKEIVLTSAATRPTRQDRLGPVETQQAEVRRADLKSGVDHFCVHTGGTVVMRWSRSGLRLSDADLEPSQDGASSVREYVGEQCVVRAGVYGGKEEVEEGGESDDDKCWGRV